MNKAYELGQLAERTAVEHLRELGYKILELNWHSHHLEIDIIAQDGTQLVIVEVKARGSKSYEHPIEAVSPKKIRFLVNAAEAYIMEKNSLLDTRFDVISILYYKGGYELEHFKDAFYPPIS